jgi:membrane fusion protein, multidrug efflux system
MLKNRSQLALITAFLMSVLFLNFGCSSDSKTKNESKETAVEVMQVHPADSKQLLRYSGTIKEYNSVPAAFPTTGIVKNVYVDEGQYVKQGELLAELDDESYVSSYNMAEAAYKQAQDAVDRLRPMHKNGNLPDVKMVQAETMLAESQSALDLAKKSLDDCKLKADKPGLVGKRTIDPGIGAAPGIAAITIVQIEKEYAVISVHESEIAALKIGMPAYVYVPALGDYEVNGKVEEIGVIADPLSHTYKVKALFSNKGGEVKPGMICNVVIPKAGARQVIVIPANALMVDEAGKTYVYTADINNMTAHRVNVTRGAFLQEGVGIVDGLSENDNLIVAGQHKLYENAPIKVINRETATAAE